MQFKYQTDLTGGTLMVRESRIVAKLLLDGVSDELWKEAVIERNVLQKNTPQTARRCSTSIKKRLEKLERSFLELMCDSDQELATQVAFYAVLEKNLLLVEFMEAVLKDAYALKVEKLASFAWFDFLEERAQRDPSIGAWAENTKKKTAQVVHKMLREVGFLPEAKSYTLQNIVLRFELKELLEQHHKTRFIHCLEVSTS